MKQVLTHHSRQHFISNYRMQHGYSHQHADRIRQELKAAGAVLYDLWLPESKSLPFMIDEDEHIKGVVYGHYADGTGALVATDKRVIFIDKKFLFVKFDDITFDVISAVSHNYVGPYGTVTLHTRVGDYKLRTFNLRAANKFCGYINKRCIENSLRRNGYGESNPQWYL